MSNGTALGNVTFTNHFIKQARHKGFTAEQIAGALAQTDPDYPKGKITRVLSRPGQLRYCGYGVAVVMSGDTAITLYADEVITPMRDDQKDDESALNSRRLNR